ncbi:MAG TPA: hypothetical protein VMU50_19535, partial [Polyangia bacterium]|nr:hypothetical protein [Polyangia bacterium]
MERSSAGTLPITGGGAGGAGTGGATVGGADDAGTTGSPGGMSGTDDAAAADVPPPLSPVGVACAQDVDCDSGFCVDSVCCTSRCDGTCQSCNLTGSPGLCLPAEVGTDPRNDCPDELAGSCARDGACDGAGQCRRYPGGTICKPAACVGATLTAAARCGDSGCTMVEGQPCDPYRCGPADVCLTSCTADSDCVAPSICIAGRCGKKPIGDQCAGDLECNSGHCEQNVCCGSACAGLCSSCALMGSEGRCTMVPPGQDPLNQCPREDPASCGLDGFCDGAGACHNYATGTICGAATCNNNLLTAAATCDGQKVCGGPAITSCGNYSCDMSGGRCRVLCAADA